MTFTNAFAFGGLLANSAFSNLKKAFLRIATLQPALFITALLFLGATQNACAGSILREVWTGISGTAVSDLTSDPRYPNQPSSTNYLTSLFEAPTDVDENYGQRLRGYIIPPVTGNYTFWIAADDGAQLWLSTDENPANAVQISYVGGWTSSREWTKEANQQSAPIPLQANRAYYVHALQKEGGGGDNLAVRWLRPDGLDEGPIPATYLLPWGTAFSAPKITQQPANTTAVEGQTATFTVGIDPLTPSSVQWQKGGVNIPGATTATLNYGPVTMGDNQLGFSAFLSNAKGSTNSQAATLTVTADTTKPTLASVLNIGPTTVRLIFSEPVDPVSGVASGNYKLNNGINVSAAAFGSDTKTILLTTSPLSYGTQYIVTVNNVKDRAAVANTILANSTISFTAVEYAPSDIGSGGTGNTVSVPGGFNISGGGTAIGGTADQFHYGYQERTGDFDIQVRVDGLQITDPWVEAGLVARETLDPASRFAGIFSSSALVGSYFEARGTAGTQSTVSAPTGGFPVNYPQMFLRLRRAGNTFSGFASLNGTNWQQLGTSSLALPAKVYFGMAVSSHNTNALATARFRDLATVASPSTFTWSPNNEKLGPSNRRTGLVFSEIMYNPPARPDTNDVEFIEIFNAENVFIDLSGWKISGGIDYTFPQGTTIQAGQFIVVAADPGALARVYSLSNAFGPYTGRLNNGGDNVKLLNAAGAVRLEVEYSPDAPWPVAADGSGHSLVLSQPSYGENDPRSWSASTRVGGSPGDVDTIWPNPWQGVVINEFLAHTDDPVFDFIELYNASNVSVDISGCFLTDSLSTNKFQIPAGTTLQPKTFRSFDQNQLGFSLSADGETIYLISADKTRVLDVIRFKGQENGVSSGRAPDGGPTIRRLNSPTAGASNAPWKVEDVVINEIMYHPISDDEADQYVELYNNSAAAVDLSQWRIQGGIDYEFLPGVSIPGKGYIVVAKDAAHLLTKYPQLNANSTFGDFSGKLNGTGERVALSKFDTTTSTNEFGITVTNKIHIVVNEVTYADGGRWPQLADGGGSSLELIDSRADTLRAANWRASDETTKGQWATLEVTGNLSLMNTAYPADKLQIAMLGAGECMVDQVEVLRSGINLLSNGDFEGGATGWTFYGHHKGSTIDATGALQGARALHVRAPGDGDTANNNVRGTLTASLAASDTVTLRARVRWLAGWPEVLFRIRGNGIELPARMTIPNNLGTPGQANSRRVNNAGPAIFDVTHTPALPKASQTVVVTCRVTDPDGVAAPVVRYRIDPSATLASVVMHDDGFSGDALANDGLFSAILPAQVAGTLVAFQIQASDDAATTGSSVFPMDAPTHECLIRFGDPIPFGTFAHYHMWDTAATENAFNSAPALDNNFRDATLVYGMGRVIYNAGFRNKGSPYHGGSGDYAVTVPRDSLLLGIDDRVFGSTGNGGSESTGMRGDVSAWIGGQLGIPYLHSHYMQLYRNGGQFREVLYDLEQPNKYHAQSWFGGGGVQDDLYKISVWFEFDDSNSGFSATSATMEKFPSSAPPYKLARYRWNWQIRPDSPTASDYSSLFNLVSAANSTTDRVAKLPGLADMEEWMRVFAYHRILGNWDSYSFSVGQNMYLYTPLGERAKLLPCDVDFVLGDGNGVSDGLSGGQDPIMNNLYSLPIYQRMLWRAYQDAINGPLQSANYEPQLAARRTALLNNGVTLADPGGIRTYIEGRRNYIQGQLQSADVASLQITSNGGGNFSTATPTITMTGTAPFAVSSIEINGVPYPITWTGVTTWSISVPLGAPVNNLTVVGKDLRGNPVPGATDSVTVTYTGTVPQPTDWVVINEIMYNSLQPNADYIELYNRHPSYSFDLSGFQLSGVDYVLPAGTFIPANGYLVIAEDPASFAAAFGATIPVLGPYSGNLQNNGETIRLIKPGSTPAQDVLIDDVRYANTLPWPTNAAGFGPSLQLVDPAQDNWRVGNWAATATNVVNMATPGRLNFSPQTLLSAFPALWINEVLPSNVNGQTDNFGEHEPWIELYNAGASTIDLSSLYLSDDPANLTRYQFPAGTTLPAGQFKLIWADNEPGETAGTQLHVNFRLNSTNGIVLLSRLQSSGPGVIDYLEYVLTSPDISFGSYPDGEPRKRRTLYIPTPAAANNPSIPSVLVYINEWMASNGSTIADPADNQYEDWFELYNAGSNPVDLSGFFLTDSTNKPTQYQIPPGFIIPPGGFKLVWADGESNQNAPGRDLHVNFSLKNEGEGIALYTPDGQSIDSISFGLQTANVSEGRFPDGAAAPFLSFSLPTPGAANISQLANKPPVIDPITDRTVNELQNVSFKITASDPDAGQTLTFDLLNPPAGASITTDGDFSWTPTETQGPAIVSITVRATDNGSPARSVSRTFKITVNEVNLRPRLAPISNATIDEGALFSFQAAGSDDDLPGQNLSYSLSAGFPAGASIDPLTGEFSWTPSENQGPGNYNITVNVTDDGQPPLSTNVTFQVAVREVNNPPVITQLSAQSLDEGTQLQVQVQATDPDLPPAALTYSLQSAPSGVSINPTTGSLTWTPVEADGPKDYNITVKVSEPGGAPSSTMSFVVGVREVNTAPSFQAISNIVAQVGQNIVINLKATDDDLPQQTLTYSAVSPLPLGASLNSQTGVFTWVVPQDPPVGTNVITLKVTDDSQPPLSAQHSFNIVVQAPYRVAINEIMHRPSTANAQYVELANYSAVNPIDISGWRLEGYDFTFAQGTVIPAGGFICVAKDLIAFRSAFGLVIKSYGNASVTVGPDGGLVRLLRPQGAGLPDEVIDSVDFSLLAPWASAAATQGASLQLIDILQDHNRVSNWGASLANVTNPPVAVETITSPWRYYQDPLDPPKNWNMPGFVESSWSLSNALFFVEDAALPAAKNTPLVLGQPSFFFRAHFNFNGNTNNALLRLNMVLDDGAIFYLNGQEIFRTNMPAGPVTRGTFATGLVGDATFQGPFDVPALGLTQGDNVIAVEVHQINATSSDVVFGAAVDLISQSPAGYTPGAPNSITTNLPAYPLVWLNEVLPLNTSGLQDNVGDRDPWIELYNDSATQVTLDGWFLSDSYNPLNKWPFPTGTVIPSKGYLLVWADGETGESIAGVPHTSFRLTQTNGVVALSRLNGASPLLIDFMNYSVGAANISYGSLQNGNPSPRQALPFATPGADNQSISQPDEPILSAVWSSTQLQLSWPSETGHRYRIEATDDIAQPSWGVINDVTGNGSTQNFVDPAVGPSGKRIRFYRVLVD
jgi:hypothetical protein